MFDKIQHISKTETNPVTRIIEQSVSPDKIADLYLEAKREATNQILDTIHVRNNVFEAAYIRFQDAKTGSIVVKWKIKINGLDLVGSVQADDADLLHADPTPFFIDKILRAEAKELLLAVKSY